MLVAPDKRVDVDVSPATLERMATDRTISADLSKVGGCACNAVSSCFCRCSSSSISASGSIAGRP